MIQRLLIALSLLACVPVWSAEWDLGPKRWEVTSDAAEIDEDTGVWMIDLSDMPTSFWETVNATDGRDIRATGADADTQKPAHIIGFVDSGSTGQGWLRVADGISASVSDSVFIYAGDPAATMPARDSTYGSENAYDANVAAAWWFDGGSLVDSTANEITLTNNNSATLTTGPYGFEAYSFNGSNQYLSAAAVPVADWPVTLEAWAAVDSTTPVYRLVNLGNHSSDTPIALLEAAGSSNAQKVRLRTRGNSGSIADGFSPSGYTTAWHHYAGTRDDGAGATSALLDGTAGVDSSTTITTPTFTRVGIGASVRTTVSDYTDGVIGPVLLHSTVRSANYLSTIRNMITAPGDVYAIGTMEEEPAGTTGHPWFYKRRN